ncbi:MAG: DUF2520 domain-containing protein [Actinomycetota bacterium]|nr:DUF2520 domain-containing protein [Actinomycetota bacterium]
MAAQAPPSSFSFALVGAGRVGTAVASLLERAGHDAIAIASRSNTSAERAREFLNAEIFDIDELPDADVVLLGASDGAIESVAGRIAPRLRPGAVVIHFAGAFGVEPLKPATKAGALAAALHPVQACPDIPTAIQRIPGSAWGVTTEGIGDWARTMIRRDLHGHPWVVPGELRAVWHAAAAVTANGIAALLAGAEGMLAKIGIVDPEKALGPLAVGSALNAYDGGGGAATLTGPVVRGEEETIRRHLDAIAAVDRSLLPIYRSTVLLIVESAERAKRIDFERARAWRELLEDYGPWK